MNSKVAERKVKNQRLNFRLNEYQAKLLSSVAEARGVSVSQYVLDTTCRQAEQDLADQCHFRVSEEKMNAFLAALDSPPKPKPRLQKLLSEPSILERKGSK